MKKFLLQEDVPNQYRKCVGACIINKFGKVLLAERTDHFGAWQMPQGGIDMGESITEALFREVYEEIGLEQNKLDIIKESSYWVTYDFPHIKNKKGTITDKFIGQAQKWFALKFLGSNEDFNLNLHNVPEFRDLMWVDILELPKFAVSFKNDVYKFITNEFKEICKTEE